MKLFLISEYRSIILKFSNFKAFSWKKFSFVREGDRERNSRSAKTGKRSAIEKRRNTQRKKKKDTSELRRIAKNGKTVRPIRVLTTFSLTEFPSWRKAGASESGSNCNRGCNCKRKFPGLSKKRRVKCVTRLQRILRPLIVERFCEIEKSSYMRFYNGILKARSGVKRGDGRANALSPFS